MINVLITGGRGQIGSIFTSLEKEFTEFHFFTPGRNELDINVYNSLNTFVIKNEIEVLVNCAAYTDVNKAETEFEIANEINHKAVINLLRIVEKHNLKFIHMSTDYIFDGKSKKPYNEKSVANPINKYGVSKNLGERVILNKNLSKTIIFRTSWVYSNYNTNFVKKILNKSQNKNEIFVVSDQIGSPTNGYDLIKVIISIIPLINSKRTKIYHYANKGSCSWYEFAKEIIKLSNSQCIVKPIKTVDQNPLSDRPKYSVLNTLKIEKDFKFLIPKWEISLKNFIKNKKH